ncbi:MAG: TMEM43 family protein [Candidatus Gracilibacteria bacterium]|jgi:hypothetical protein|nr:TMEM43 family protein [Candidatus Gracilibacteria bacterium]
MQKVVSETVVGSANPFFKFFRELSASIKGIATGILMIIIGFIMVWFFAHQVEHSKTIAGLPLQTPSEVSGSTGMVKIHDFPTYENLLVAPNTEKEVLYYTIQEEEYAIREKKSSRTIVRDGQEVKQEIVDYVPEWRTISTETKWSDFNLGGIKINPGNAKLQMTTSQFFTETVDVTYDTTKAEDQLVDVPQKRRTTITGVPKEDEIIAVGMLSNNLIATGDEDGTFFLSNKSEQVFIEDQAKAESTMFWVMVFISWFLMTTGFTMILGPITKILNIIPGVGGLVSGLLFIIFGILSAMIIGLSYIGMKYWWAILLLIVVAIGVFVMKKVKKA